MLWPVLTCGLSAAVAGCEKTKGAAKMATERASQPARLRLLPFACTGAGAENRLKAVRREKGITGKLMVHSAVRSAQHKPNSPVIVS